MPRFDVTTIGEGQLRYSVPAGTRLELASQLQVHACGTEANVTALLSRLGWRCGWVSGLPRTPLGRRVSHEFRLSGLDLSAVVWSDTHRLATYYVEYAVPPRSVQVYFDRADTAFTHLQTDQINWDYLLDTRLLHLSGLSLALSPSVRTILFEAVRRAKAANVPVSFDVNYRSRLWTPQVAAETMQEILQAVDMLFCGRSDAQTLFGCAGEPREIVRCLARLTTARHIITSLGADGLIGWDGETFYPQPAREVVMLDRIGAGDAMVAGVLHGWLQGNFAQGVRYGALTAALALSQYGDLVVTTPEEVEALLAVERTDITR